MTKTRDDILQELLAIDAAQQRHRQTVVIAGLERIAKEVADQYTSYEQVLQFWQGAKDYFNPQDRVTLAQSSKMLDDLKIQKSHQHGLVVLKLFQETICPRLAQVVFEEGISQAGKMATKATGINRVVPSFVTDMGSDLTGWVSGLIARSLVTHYLKKSPKQNIIDLQNNVDKVTERVCQARQKQIQLVADQMLSFIVYVSNRVLIGGNEFNVIQQQFIRAIVAISHEMDNDGLVDDIKRMVGIEVRSLSTPDFQQSMFHLFATLCQTASEYPIFTNTQQDTLKKVVTIFSLSPSDEAKQHEKSMADTEDANLRPDGAYLKSLENMLNADPDIFLGTMDFWKHEYTQRTSRASKQDQEKYTNLTADLIVKSQKQIESLIKNPENIILLLISAKKYFEKTPTPFWSKDVLRSQLESLVSKLGARSISKDIQITIKTYYVEFLGGEVDKFPLGTESYKEKIEHENKEKAKKQKNRQSIVDDRNRVLAGHPREKSLTQGISEEDVLATLHFYSPSKESKEDDEETEATLDNNTMRGQAQFLSHAMNTELAKSTLDYRIRGSLYFAIKHLFSSLSSTNTTLAETKTEFDVKLYQKIGHIVKTDFLERATKWMTKNYLTHDTMLRTSWMDTSLTSEVKNVTASIIGSVSGAIVGEIFYRLLPPDNSLNSELSNTIKEAEGLLSDKYRNLIELISTEMLRIIIYIKNTPDPAKVNSEINAILSQINNAVAVLTNEIPKESAFAKLFGLSKTVTPSELQRTIYQLCSDLCLKSAHAINDNVYSKEAAEAVQTPAQSLLDVVKHLGIGLTDAISQAVTSNSTLYVFNDVQCEQLLYIANHFNASNHLLSMQELYQSSIRADDKFNKSCALVLSKKKSLLLGSPKAWELDCRVRAESANPQQADYKNNIRRLKAKAKKQVNEIILKPRLLIDLLKSTQQFINQYSDDAERIELLPKLRLQILEITIYMQEYLYAKQARLLTGKDENFKSYETDVIQALGSAKQFYIDVLQGDPTDIYNARNMRASQSVLKNGVSKLESKLKAAENKPLLFGSPALWLSSYTLCEAKPDIHFSGQNPPLTARNVDLYIDNTLKFLNELSEKDPALHAFYRLFLLKQITEIIILGASTSNGNAYVRGALENRLLMRLFNGKITYPILDDMALLAEVTFEFNSALLHLMAYFPDQLDLFELTQSVTTLIDKSRGSEVLHGEIDNVCEKQHIEQLEQAKQRALEEKQTREHAEVKALMEEKNHDIDPSPDYTRYKDRDFIEESLQRQLDNKVRADSLNTGRDMNASILLGQVDDLRSSVTRVINAGARAAGKAVDSVFGLREIRELRLSDIDPEKSAAFFERIAEWGAGVAARTIVSWKVEDATKPILTTVKNFFAPPGSPKAALAGIVTDYAAQATGWLAGIFAQRLMSQLLHGALNNELKSEQREKINQACIDLCSNYQSTIQTIAGYMLIIITYVEKHPNGIELNELNGILSQLNGAIAALCQQAALQPKGLLDVIKETIGQSKTVSPNELQKQLLLLSAELCETASHAKAAGIVGKAAHALQGDSTSVTGVVGRVGVGVLDTLSEFTRNQRLLTEFNSLQRSTLRTLSNKLHFQANTLDTRLANESINRVDQDYLQRITNISNSTDRLKGSPQSWVGEYRRYVTPVQDDIQRSLRKEIKKCVKRAANQCADLLIHPEKIGSLLEHMLSLDANDNPPNYTLQVREQLVQLAYGLEKNLMLLANGYTINGIDDSVSYSKKAAIALGHIKYHYVNHFYGDSTDINNALRLRFSKPMLMDSMTRLQAILKDNPACCRGSEKLWLSAQRDLNIPLSAHMVNSTPLTPKNIKSWLNNTRLLLNSLGSSDPEVAELYRLFVIKQICELVTERFDSFIQFAAQDFLTEMELDFSTIQAVANFSETQFDFSYSFQAMLALLKDNVCLRAKSNIYMDPLIEASDRVADYLTRKKILEEQRVSEERENNERKIDYENEKRSHKRTEAMSQALYDYATLKSNDEKSAKSFKSDEVQGYHLDTVICPTLDTLKITAEQNQRKADTQLVTHSAEQKSEVFSPLLDLSVFFKAINRTLDRVTDTPVDSSSLADLPTEFLPDTWQEIKQFVVSSAVRDGSGLAMQKALSSAPPGISTVWKLTGGVAVSLASFFLGKATEWYLTPENSLNVANDQEAKKSEHYRALKPTINTISTEMMRLLVAICTTDRVFNEEALNNLIQPFVRGIVTLIPQSIKTFNFFSHQNETTATLQVTSKILELCIQMCLNAKEAIKDNPAARFLSIHQFSFNQRKSLDILVAKFKRVIADIQSKEQRLSLAHLTADDKYDEALENWQAYQQDKQLLLGDDNSWRTDFAIRSVNSGKEINRYRGNINTLVTQSFQQTQDLAAAPLSIEPILNATCEFLKNKEHVNVRSRLLALQPKIRLQVLHIAHAIIKNLHAMANAQKSEPSVKELKKIQQYTRDAIAALSVIRTTYSKLGGDPSDFENILQLSHGTHKPILTTAFATLKKLTASKPLLVGSGRLWAAANLDDESKDDQNQNQLVNDSNVEEYLNNTFDLIRTLQADNKPQLAQLYRLLVIKQLAELIANQALNEDIVTKLTQNVFSQFGITSYLAIYEIANIDYVKFGLQHNLMTLVGLVPDQFNMQQLAVELGLDLSTQLGGSIDAMIRSALLVDTLRTDVVTAKTSSKTGNDDSISARYDIALTSTIDTMMELNAALKTPLPSPLPVVPPPSPRVEMKKEEQPPSISNVLDPIIKELPPAKGRFDWLTKGIKSFCRGVSRLFQCFGKTESTEPLIPKTKQPEKLTYSRLFTSFGSTTIIPKIGVGNNDENNNETKEEKSLPVDKATNKAVSASQPETSTKPSVLRSVSCSNPITQRQLR